MGMANIRASPEDRTRHILQLMRDFVQRQQQARAYEDFLRGKVDLAREQIANGQHASNEEVEARFAALRAEVLNNTGKGG